MHTHIHAEPAHTHTHMWEHPVATADTQGDPNINTSNNNKMQVEASQICRLAATPGTPRNRCDIFRSTGVSIIRIWLCACCCVSVRLLPVYGCVSWQNKPQNANCTFFPFHLACDWGTLHEKATPKNFGAHVCAVRVSVCEYVSDVCACPVCCKPTQTIRTGLCVYTHAHIHTHFGGIVIATLNESPVPASAYPLCPPTHTRSKYFARLKRTQWNPTYIHRDTPQNQIKRLRNAN